MATTYSHEAGDNAAKAAGTWITYPEFRAIAKKNPDTVYRWDSGNGWRSEGQYSRRLKRFQTWGINREGMEII